MCALEMARDGLLVPAAAETAQTQAQASAAAKKKTTSLRSWISLDHDGQGTVLDLDKHAIIRRVQIHARDLRLLDPLLSYPSTILGREKVIVLNLEHIKAIITADEVLLRDPLDDNVLPIVEELQRRLPPSSANFNGQGEEEDASGVQKDGETDDENEFPFEFRALEVALEGICSFLDAQTRQLEAAAYPALDELTSKVRDELEQLLDDDDDMADLYLSRKMVGTSPVSDSGAPNWSLASPTITIGSKVSRTSRASAATTVEDENDVEELEMLLEAYFMQIDGTLNKLTTLREYIDDTEDYINIQLDNHRNQLIQLELFLSSGTVCLSMCSLVAAIFGMNIPYTWNDGHEYVFKWVIIVTGMVCASLFLLIMSYAQHKGLVGS
ncbi:magnesium transporter MRS2-I-like isoform X2 [Pyrus communis]|uniref:magnesium transporter MRS2-I-like isoform X2 n=1 Tax=Pyrus communis TaxID=23211 RepID=UPI0035C0492A